MINRKPFNSRLSFQEYYALSLIVILYASVYLENSWLPIVLLFATVPVLHKPLLIFPVYFVSGLAGTLFVFHEGASVSRYLSIVFLLSILINLLWSKRLTKKSVVPFWLIYVLVTFNLISSFTSLTGSFNLFFGLLINIIVLFLFSKLSRNENINLFKLVYLSSGITLVLFVIDVYLSGFSVYLIESRFTIDDEVNMNRLAMFLAQLGIISLLPIYFTNPNKHLKITSVALFITALFFVFITGSRGAFLAMFLSSFLLLFLNIDKTKLKFYVVSGSFLIITLYGFWLYIESLNLPMFDRFTVEGLQSSGGTSARLYSINLLFQHVIPENLIFGIGLGGTNIVEALRMYGTDKPAHNIIIDMLAQIGFFGLLLYGILYVGIIRRIFKYRKRIIELILPLAIVVTALINGFSENTFSERSLWGGLTLGAFYINNYLYNKTEIENNKAVIE